MEPEMGACSRLNWICGLPVWAAEPVSGRGRPCFGSKKTGNSFYIPFRRI